MFIILTSLMVSSVGGNIDSQKWNPASKLAIGLSERRCSNQCLDDYIIHGLFQIPNILFSSRYYLLMSNSQNG